MTTEIDRKLAYADRTATQQADQTIKKDVVRAIIELITNVDDSYRRAEQRKDSAQVSSEGIIKISIMRKQRGNTSIRVSDGAEGLTPERMDECVGTYSGETSGLTEGLSVRGYFGRGLKEAILGLGMGKVFSIHEGHFTQASIENERRATRYKREKPIRATRVVREQFGILGQNGTTVEITTNRPGVRVPQIQNLRTRLERYYALREILSNPRRKVLLTEVDQRGKVKKEFHLQYRFPAGDRILNQEVFVEGYPQAKFQIEVFRSSEPLAGPGVDKETADGGLIVKSAHAILDLSLFKFEHDAAAERLFGTVNCAHLDDLLISGEPIVKADRTGIDWSHEFAKALKRGIERTIEPLVAEERRRAKESQQSALSKELKEKIGTALPELNKLAQIELGKFNQGDDLDDDIPFVPESGFGFVPEYAQIVVGKQGMLLLRASKNGPCSTGTIVQIKSESEMVMIHTEQVILEQDTRFESILSGKVVVEGRQVGAESLIVATVGDLSAEAFIKVISKRETKGTPEPEKRKGLFQDVKFDEHADPRNRVRFDNGIIVVAVTAPSVCAYIGPGGEGTDEPQGQVMLAELVTEAVCREIARRGVLTQKFIAATGAETDAQQREYLRLVFLHAAKIHELFVAPEFRGSEVTKKFGRPLKEITLSRATMPA